MNVLYHPGKANIVADALSRLSMGSVAHIEEENKELAKDVHRFASFEVGLMDMSDGGAIVQNRVVAKATRRSAKWQSHHLVDILGSPTYWRFGRAKSGLADLIGASPNAQPHRLVDLPP
ncbi:hypothetical protein MTR67_011530 [Solanum verrucosum]|uniref:Pol protein n=1 Tax=Solanum verrucosum TaxID=315347 RepID=A0AAF0TM28_SOLVR|nr:hypothetical protein MTR67_011530 [Solanum verrucosum]